MRKCGYRDRPTRTTSREREHGHLQAQERLGQALHGPQKEATAPTPQAVKGLVSAAAALTS